MSEKKTYRLLFSDAGRSLVDPTLIAHARVGKFENPVRTTGERLEYAPAYFIDLTMNFLGLVANSDPSARNRRLDYTDEATRNADYQKLQQCLCELCGITLVSLATSASEVKNFTA